MLSNGAGEKFERKAILVMVTVMADRVAILGR